MYTKQLKKVHTQGLFENQSVQHSMVAAGWERVSLFDTKGQEEVKNVTTNTLGLTYNAVPYCAVHRSSLPLSIFFMRLM